MSDLRNSRLSKLVAAALFTGVVASCDDPTRPTIEASIEPRIQLLRADSATRASLVLPLTEVRVRTFGPTGRVVPLTLEGGVWRGTITGLTAGDYELVVEGLANGQVQYYGRLPNITVGRGERAQPTVQFAPSVPVVTNPPLQNTTSFSQRVPFAAIPAATGYVVQVSQDNNFVNGVTEFTSADTNPLVNVTQPGTWYMRSRAVLPQVPATSIPWSDVRSWVVIEADGGDDAGDGTDVPLAPESPQTVGERNLTPNKRNDWFDIALQQGDSLFAETFAARLSFPSNLNTTLALFRNDGTTEVAQNLDAAGTTDSRIIYVAATSETYKLRVGASSNTSGHYELRSEIRRLPLAPTGLVATVVSGTQVSLVWGDNANNETSYRIERCAGAGCTNFAEVGSTAAGVSSSSQTGLTQGTTYRWQVRARNNVGNSAYSNIAVTALVGPDAPTNLAASTLSNTSIRITWSDVATNETGYEIQRCIVSGGCNFAALTSVAANVAEYVDASAVYNTTYQYQVRATNSVLPSAYAAPVTANTIPPTTPTGLLAQVASPTTINLSWTDASADETHFLIERCLGDGCANFAQIDSVGAGVTAYVSTVATNSAYRFRVRARNAVISQTYSSVAEATTRPPAVPGGLVATTLGATAISLQWDDLAGDETGYLVERCSGASCSDFTTIATTAANAGTFGDNGVTVNGTYRYRVSAVGVAGTSAPSNIATANTLLPAAPSGLVATVISANVIRLTWSDNATNETGYSISRCAGASCTNFAVVKSIGPNLSQTDDSTTVAGVNYLYRVQATNVAGVSNVSNNYLASTLPPSAPTGLVANLVSGSRIDLDWSNTDASSIGTRVERCAGVACNDFVEITFVAGSANAHDDFTTSAGNYYRYRLRAQNAADVSTYTAIVDVDARFMSAPAAVSASVTNPSPAVTVTWTASTGPGLTGYEIQRCDAAACTNFVNVGGVAAVQNSFTQSVTLGQRYRYLVRAVNVVGPGPFSDTVDVNTLLPSAPSGAAASLVPGAVRITWTDNADNETGSVVERCEGAGCSGFAAIGSPVAANVATFNDATAVAGTSYSYRVYATNLLGNSAATAVVSVTPFLPVAPNGLALTTVSGTQINLTWVDNSLNETGFEIRRCAGDGCSNFAAIDSVGAGVTAFSDLTVTSGQSYSYSVAAFAEFGTSNTSSEATITTRVPVAPSGLVAQTLSNSSVRLTWADNSDNETQFNIRQCAGVSCTPAPLIFGLGAGATQYDVTGLNTNETYSFAVVAANTVGESSPSEIATATTNLPPAPTPVSATPQVGATSIQLQWTLVTNATNYSIERCEGASCTNFSELVSIPEDGSTNSYLDAGLTGGATYRYQIKAVNVAGSSAYSAILTRTLAAPLAPSGLSVSVQPGFFAQLNWTDNSNNESGFEIERCLGVGCSDFANFVNVGADQTGGIDNPLGFGDYRYRVRAVSTLGNSVYSNEVALSFYLPDAPTVLTATTFSATQIDLAWTDGGPYESGYEIQRCSGPICSNFAIIDTTDADAVSFSDAGLATGQSFSYRVRAVNIAGQSAFTNTATAATDLPAAPSGVTAVIDNPTDVTLNWTDNAGNEDEFFIERCEGNNCNNFAFLTNVGADVTTYQDAGLTTGNTYRYRVQASNSAGASPFAPVAEAALVTPQAPTGFTATVVAGNQVNLSWTDASNNELNFSIERCGGAGCSSFALRFTSAANAVAHADAVGVDSTYVYRIRALNNVGVSAYASAVEVNTIRPDQPTGFTASTFAATQIDLAWTDVAGNEGGYLVERCAGVSCADFDTLALLSPNVQAYQDQGLTAQQSYSYRITAYNVAGDRGSVGPATATTFVPALPTDLTGFAQSASQIDLSWTDIATNELGYRIERCAGAGCQSFVEVGTVGVNVDAFSSTGLVINTVYRFRIRAFNSAGTSAYTTALQVLTSAPTNPASLTATVLTASEVSLTFNDNSTNEAGFIVQRCFGSTCTDWVDIDTIPGSTPASATGPQTYVDTTLSAGQQPRYRVRSYNGVASSSGSSNIVLASTEVPASPSAAVAFAQGQAQTFVQWSDNATNEGGYIIERCVGETCTNFAQIVSVAANIGSFNDATVSGGLFYRYRIRATGNGSTSFGASGYSNVALVSTIIPANPSALTAVAISDTRVDLSWTNNANNAEDFRVFRCAVAACVPTDQVGVTGGGGITTYTDLTAVANTLYRYAVSATNGAGESGVTNVAEVTTNVPSLPTQFVATVTSPSNVQLTWTDNASTETGYEIERCEGASCTGFVNLTTTAANATSFNDGTVSTSMVYRYRIRATTGATFSGYTAPALVSTSAPSAPGSVTITPTATNLEVNWTDVATDETSYEVERCTGTDCTGFANVATLAANATQFSEAWLVDEIYRYRVRAVNAAGASVYSSIITQSTFRPAAPLSFTATTATSTAIDLAWTAGSANATGYRLFRCVGASCIVAETQTLSPSLTAYRDESLASSADFTYDLSAFNIFGDSPRAGEVTASTNFPTVPANLTASTISATEVSLQWSDVSPNETGFEVYRCDGASCTPNLLITTTAPNTEAFADLGVSLGNLYRYHVRAINGAGASPVTSVVETNTLLPVDPGAVQVFAASPTSVELTWALRSNTTQYLIERCTTPGCSDYASLTTVAHPETTFVDNSVATNETYGYRVRGVNVVGTSVPGTGVELAMFAPTTVSLLTAFPLSGTQVQLNWNDDSNNELGFIVERCSGGGCFDFALVETVNAGATMFVDATVLQDERYVYQVTAFNNVGQATPQQVQMQTTAPDAPSGLVATTTAPGTIDLSWTLPVSNALNVAVERCSGALCTNFTQIQLLGAAATSYQDTGLPTNVVWRYQVRAINNVGPSAFSNIDQANTIVPTQVTDLALTVVNGNRIDLGWTDVGFESDYLIERCDGSSCTNFSELATVPAGSTSYADNSGVAFNASYTYRVTGRNVAGSATPSATPTAATVLNAPQSVAVRVLNRTQVRTTWTYTPSMTQYAFQIMRCVGAGCDPNAGVVVTTVPSSAALEYIDNVPQNFDLTYAVRPVTLGGTANLLAGPAARTPINLTSAVAVTGVTDVAEGERHYVLSVPADALALRVRLTPSNADPDLYVKFGSAPQNRVVLNDAQNCVPFAGGIETCEFQSPAAGDWYVMVHGFSNAYSNATFKASLSERLGWPVMVSGDITAFSTLLVSHSFTITEPTSVTHLGLRLAAAPAGTNIRVGLYSSRVAGALYTAPGEPDQPDQLLTQIDIAGAVAGINELAVSEIVLQPGKYWLASVANLSATYGNSGQSGVYRYFAPGTYSYAGGFPAIWPAADTYTTFTRHNIFVRGFR